ncbi:hypothetical protein D3C71_1225190 [compost metagenome]
MADGAYRGASVALERQPVPVWSFRSLVVGVDRQCADAVPVRLYRICRHLHRTDGSPGSCGLYFAYSAFPAVADGAVSPESIPVRFPVIIEYSQCR